MAFTSSWIVLFLLAIALFDASTATTYKVGDNPGWTASGTVDYDKWASTKNFQVGDELVFRCSNLFHNVMEVSRQDYESCNSSSPILTYTTGLDSVKLVSAGHHYYLCGIPGHCEAGQKIDIYVKDCDCCRPSMTPPDHNSASSSTVFISLKWLLILGISLAYCCVQILA